MSVSVDTKPTPVIFRCWPGGDVVALFPSLAGNYTGSECVSYEHIGQHSAASLPHVMKRTRAARLAEYVELKKELECIGYVLGVRGRETEPMRSARRKMAAEWMQPIPC